MNLNTFQNNNNNKSLTPRCTASFVRSTNTFFTSSDELASKSLEESNQNNRRSTVKFGLFQYKLKNAVLDKFRYGISNF